MRSIKQAAVVCGVLLFAIFLRSSTLHAQTPAEGFNIITSPLPINLQTAPETTLKTDIRIKNGSTKTERLKVSLMKFAAYGEEGKPSIAERAPGDDYFDWVTFSPSVFDAPPNEWVTIKMTINVPKTAAFGYYYAAAFSRAGTPKPGTNKENVLVGSTAVLVLVDVKSPNSKRVAGISSFTANKKFYEFLPSTFNIKIRNSGNVHLIPTGNIFITRGGKAVATLDVNKVAGNVLPGSNRIFSTSWNDGFPVYALNEENGKSVLDKNGKQITALHWDFTKASHLKIGHYTAHLVMAYDNGLRDVPLEATVSFWVIPVRVILLAIAIPTVPSLIVYLLMKRRFKRKLAKSMKAKAEVKKNEDHN